jgi:hypothetical protein
MTALLLLTHESADRVDRMVDYWRKSTRPEELVVAYGGPAAEFGKIGGRKVFIDDARLRTRDHQRERQSYIGVLRGALEALGDAEWKWLYLAEYDMLPLDSALWERLISRARAEGADLLGHRMWRIDDTLHPHYASHLATPEWLEWLASFSCRANPRVVNSCMGCGQFWRRKALEEVVAMGEPERAYLELQLPSVAHHLGFRVRGLGDQDRFISNDVIHGANPELLRDTGGWVMHPLKNLWKEDGLKLPEVARKRERVQKACRFEGADEDCGEMEGGWMGDLGELLDRIARVASGPKPIRVMRGGRRFAVGLPEDRMAARVVLDLYHPHRMKGKMFRFLAKSALALKIERKILSPGGGGVDVPEVGWLREAAGAGTVGFIGSNPVHGPRCLLGGQLPDQNRESFVGKLGFDHSREAIIRESATLERLSGRYVGVLRPLSFDSGADWALLRLPYLGFRTPHGMDDPAVIDLLVEWLGKSKAPLGEIPWAEDLLARAEASGVDPNWCRKIRGRMIRVALVHGDFAVWNLRMLSVGPCAIDWEWAEEHGPGGVDLAHGLRQEAVMIRDLKPKQAVDWVLAHADKHSWNAYLGFCGWAGAHEDWLKFGLLHSHFNAKSDSREMLRVLECRV